MDTQKIVKHLKQIVKPEQILTDLEDLYVYSFEKIFEKQNLLPDIVVKTLSFKEAQRILELAGKCGFTVVKRREPINTQRKRKPLVLIDDVLAPELKRVPSNISGTAEILDEIHERGYGSPRNLTLGLRAFFLEKNFAKCEECKICSGYCTVASSFEGVETWSSKGRALIIRGLQNGELAISKKMVDILYTCTECGLCFAQCSEDLELNEAILAIRHQIAEKGLAPDIFHEIAKNIMDRGDPGAVSVKRRLSWMKNFSFQSQPEKAEVLYWVGCMVATRTPNTAKAVFNILNRNHVDFTMLGRKEGCCGYVLLSSGLWDEAKKVASEVIQKIEEIKIINLITPCAGCYYTFTKLYPEILGVSLPCKVLHSSQFLEKMISDKELKLQPLSKKVGQTFLYRGDWQTTHLCHFAGLVWGSNANSGLSHSGVTKTVSGLENGEESSLDRGCPCYRCGRHCGRRFGIRQAPNRVLRGLATLSLPPTAAP